MLTVVLLLRMVEQAVRLAKKDGPVEPLMHNDLVKEKVKATQ